MTSGPDPDILHPLPAAARVVFLAPLAEGRERVEIGRFAYADLPAGPESFFRDQVLHHYPHMGDSLRIGAFTALAAGVTFVMNGAAHGTDGVSTYPFEIFGQGWEAGFDPADYPARSRGDTVIGPDVWIGDGALVLPGTRIGAGAIVGARAVVSGTVPPYAVVAGNPARVVRMRFSDADIARLLAIAWWDWPVEKITAMIPAIRGGDIDALEAA